MGFIHERERESIIVISVHSGSFRQRSRKVERKENGKKKTTHRSNIRLTDNELKEEVENREYTKNSRKRMKNEKNGNGEQV